MPCGGFDTLEPAAFFCAGEEGSRNPLLWKPGAEFSAMPGAVPEQPGSVGSGRERPGTEKLFVRPLFRDVGRSAGGGRRGGYGRGIGTG